MDIGIIINKFENFINRAIIPSTTFILFGFIIYLYSDIKLNFNLFDNYLLIIILLIGISLFLNILQQIIFDNNIKNYYNTKIFWCLDNKTLDSLRKQVILKLKTENNIEIQYTDYNIYLLLGKKFLTNAERFVNETKSIGIISISFCLFLLIFLYIQFGSGSLFISLPICGFIIILSFETILAKYRSRALKLYINYLQENDISNSSLFINYINKR